MNIDKTIQSALECHRKGNLKQAEILYKKILKKQPRNSDILNMIGELFCRLAKYDQAIKYIRKALQFEPTDIPSAYCNLGLALREEGHIDEAVTCCQKALQLRPSFAEAYCNLGWALHGKGQLDEAITYYQKALQLRPAFAGAYCNLGWALYGKGQIDEAIAYYQKALQINPSLTRAYFNLGLALFGKGQIDNAIAHYEKAIQINPSFVEAHSNLGAAFIEKGDLDNAIAHYEKAIQINPSFVEAHSNLGAVFIAKGDLDNAITYGQKAIRINPSFVEAYCVLGVAFAEKGDFDNAIAHYQKALQLNPDFETANFNISMTLLKLGNLRDGWDKYEWRWKETSFLKISRSRRPSEFSQPGWNGSSLKGKSLLIHSEQGVGDEIMFASCFEEAIEQSDKCIIECDKRLIPILSRSFPEAIFVERAKDPDISPLQLPKTDLVISIGSLPRFLRTDLDAFPGKSYLIPDAEKEQAWRNRLKSLGEGLLAGISWRGGSIPKVRRARSIMLERWADLFALSGVHFVNLQYGDCKNELEEAKEKLGVTIHDWDDANPLQDLDNFAAQIAALDLVISIDNATVHMAGALGVPVWTLLPFVPDWRWMLDREDSPWYSSMRLFRQPSPGDWESVIAEVKNNLVKLSGKN